ncbi:hypothetical protein UlMin_022592 [Ulmus minor]
MRISTSFPAIFLSIILLFIPTIMFARPIDHHPTRHNYVAESNRNNSSFGSGKVMEEKSRRGRPLEVAAGSRLPDCSHACGSCKPCRLLTVSFLCAELSEAETCPISYRCMCNSRSYPIP